MPHQLLTIYNKILAVYGQQGWWPLLRPSASSLTAKRKAHSKEEAVITYSIPITHPHHRFEIAVGAILTQNTAWTNAEKALVALHENELHTPQKIISAPHEKLAHIIRSAGYFNQKAERLKVIAYFFLINDITNLPLTILRTKLLGLKGIGPETADSIILYAAEQPIFVVDAYTRRIFSRLGYGQENASYDKWQQFFHQTMQRDVAMYKEYHALLVEHAKQHCKKKPLCMQCPLENMCERRI